jgi:hypothetical protein
MAATISERALEMVPNNAVIGLGSGRAAQAFVRALASRWGAATFNRPGFEMFDFDVYALCGDGRISQLSTFRR